MRAVLTFDIKRFDSIDSTNRYLLDQARAGAPEGMVAVADHQTAGRGRRGRSWRAPPGGSLLCSVLLRPSLPADRTHLLTMAAGVALCESIEKVAGFSPTLKWPNDLVVGDRKLAGILAEADVRADSEATAVVVGVGVNVVWPEFPAALADTATACNVVARRDVDRDALLECFLQRLADRYTDLERVPAAYRARLSTLGRRVRVERPDGELVGQAVGLGPSGELLVARGDDRVVVRVGDVVHLRDA